MKIPWLPEGKIFYFIFTRMYNTIHVNINNNNNEYHGKLRFRFSGAYCSIIITPCSQETTIFVTTIMCFLLCSSVSTNMPVGIIILA